MPLQRSVYDSVPYPNRAFAQTHPDRLAVMGTLLGMSPAPVERCRVLELACGDGSNLIPMAYGLPRSDFRGVDLAEKPVQSANEMIKRAALNNIRIDGLDLREVDESFGRFDYIIAHGVYAWVPEQVQDKILSICAANLAENGIAFISYNTHPAGYVRQLIREMVLPRASQESGSRGKVQAAREVIDAILKAAKEGSAWKALLKEECVASFARDDHVIFHDDLGTCFAPVSFSEFAQRAAKERLQILGEAKFGSLAEPEVSTEGLEALGQLAGDDRTAFENYLDFATYRKFRQTLVCHAEVPLKRDAVMQEAKKLLVASPLRVMAEKPDGSVELTNTRASGTIQTNAPFLIAALKHLQAIWPRAAPFAELQREACQRAPDSASVDTSNELVQALMSLSARNLVDWRAHHFRVANRVSDEPAASLLSRLQVQAGSLVTTLLHTHVEIEDEHGREFLALLDGAHNREAIANAMALEGRGYTRESALQQVENNLLRFYRLGLLVA